MDKETAGYFLLTGIGVVDFVYGMDYLLRPGHDILVGIVVVIAGLIIAPLAFLNCIRAARRPNP